MSNDEKRDKAYCEAVTNSLFRHCQGDSERMASILLSAIVAVAMMRAVTVGNPAICDQSLHDMVDRLLDIKTTARKRAIREIKKRGTGE